MDIACTRVDLNAKFCSLDSDECNVFWVPYHGHYVSETPIKGVA